MVLWRRMRSRSENVDPSFVDWADLTPKVNDDVSPIIDLRSLRVSDPVLVALLPESFCVGGGV